MTGTTRRTDATGTPTQAATVAVLDALSRPPHWVVDANPVADVATELCGNDWAHGPGIVYGGRCKGLCLPCAVAAVTLDSWAWGSTGLNGASLDVLRHPAELRVRIPAIGGVA
jgi:hypothetical protein